MSAVDRYLGDLGARLLLPPATRDRLLEEVEAHLHESALLLGSEDAAVATFGPARNLARAANRTPAAIPGALASVARLFLPIGAVAVVSVVAATLLARLLARLTSASYVYASASGGTAGSAADCSHWEKLHPGALSCAAAHVLESQHDSVALVLLAAPVALVGCAVALGLLRLVRGRVPVLHASARLANIAGGLTFLGAAVVLAAADSTARISPVDLGGGVGLRWTCAAVATVVASVYATRLVLANRAESTPDTH